MSKNADRRLMRTKKALKQAMLDLLKKKDISKVTVTELSERADISRATFYLHYADPYDLLEKIMYELLAQLSAPYGQLLHAWDENSLLVYMESIWQYTFNNKDAFKILMNPRSGTQFMERMKKVSLNGALALMKKKEFNDKAEEYNIIYNISGSLAVFQKWMDENAPIPPDELAKLMKNMLLK
jgi:AcrR family transcriptional regulator